MFKKTFLAVHSTNTGGFYALLDNILDEIPQEEVVTLFFDKMDSSANFSAFLEWMGTNDFKNLLNILRVRIDSHFKRKANKILHFF